jgi:hypothetical protein
MWRNLLAAIVVLVYRLHPVIGQFQQKVVDCRNSPGTKGYESISAINDDMMKELVMIGAGKKAQLAYKFVLCPKTDFDTSNGTLTPLLNGAMFLCGDSGSRTNQCRLTGGATQITIEDSLVARYPVNTVQFMGITLTGFTGSGISGDAGSNTTVTLNEVDFVVSEFDSPR